MSKVVTVQDYLKHKHPDKYQDSTNKQKEIEFGSEGQERELLTEIEKLQEKNETFIKKYKKLEKERDFFVKEIQLHIKLIKKLKKENKKLKEK